MLPSSTTNRGTHGWVFRLAWQDLRGSASRLLLYFASIVVGVAALAAVESFRHNVRSAIDEQAQLMLGADIAMASRRPVPVEAETVFEQIPGRRAREWRFYSMVTFPESGDTRLANVRGVDPDFPFYGSIDTDPPSAAADFQDGLYALVDESLLFQFDAAVGDPIRIGAQTFTILGALKGIPGEIGAATLFVGPRVYIPLATVEGTALVQPGSLVRYRTYFQIDRPAEIEAAVRRLDEEVVPMGFDLETVERRKYSTGEAMERVTRFLQLLSLTALLLGGIGVSSGIQMQVRRRLQVAAILRCLGASRRGTFAVFLLQVAGLAALAALVGAALGRVVQMGLPRLLGDLLPVALDAELVPMALGTAMGAGFLLCFLFALFPLLALRRVSPAGALRESDLHESRVWFDPARAAVAALIALLFGGFAFLQTETPRQAFGFLGGLALAFAALAGAALLAMALLRRLRPSAWPFVIRQGLGNLYRPNNRTVTMILSIGLGVSLLSLVYLVYASVMAQTERTGEGDLPNLILFDIQPGEVRQVRSLLLEDGFPVHSETPIVTMRLERLKGRPVTEWRRERNPDMEDWALDWEYRTTYRADLTETEALHSGEWHPRWREGEPVPISIDIEMTRALNIGLGDRLTFDVHGMPLEVVVASVRNVNWQKMTTNFFVVFPPGVLEQAPHFFAMVSRAESPADSARLQRAVGRNFPHVSIIDLNAILESIEGLLDRVRFVFRFMSLFTILTGALVVCGAILTGNSQRTQESLLLRTLGASERQLKRIYAAEYIGLGSLSALLGLGLAHLGAWAVCRYVMKVPLAFSPSVAMATLVLTIGLTWLLGMSLSFGAVRRPPLQRLREEQAA